MDAARGRLARRSPPPGAPEWYRRMTLGMLKKLSRLFGSVYSKKAADVPQDVDYGFTQDDIVIEAGVQPSVNILCVAKKSSRPSAPEDDNN